MWLNGNSGIILLVRQYKCGINVVGGGGGVAKYGHPRILANAEIYGRSLRKRRDADSTRGHGQMLYSSIGLRCQQTSYFSLENLNLDGGNGKYPFAGLAAQSLTNSNFQIETQPIEAVKPTTTTIAQRQEDVYPHVVMDVLPFQRASSYFGKCRNLRTVPQETPRCRFHERPRSDAVQFYWSQMSADVLFLVWKSKSGWWEWEIPLRRFGGHSP